MLANIFDQKQIFGTGDAKLGHGITNQLEREHPANSPTPTNVTGILETTKEIDNILNHTIILRNT